MGLVHLQRAIAKLYTDEAARRRFFSDPQAFAQDFDLDAQGLAQLQELSRQDLSFFAKSLQHKRMNLVRQLLPLTHKLLKEDFHPLFHQFADLYVPKGIHKHQEDAHAFSRYVARQTDIVDAREPWFLELLRYESACLRANDPRHRWQLHRYRYPIHTIARSLFREEVPTPHRQTTWILWLRPRPTSPLRRLEWTPPWSRSVEHTPGAS